MKTRLAISAILLVIATALPGVAVCKEQAYVSASNVEKQKIKQQIRSWAQSWSDKNVDDYFLYYAPNFSPELNMDSEKWKALRRQRIETAASITISTNRYLVLLTDKNNAKVIFKQTYRSDKYREKSVKRLDMSLIEGVWKITRERSFPLRRKVKAPIRDTPETQS